MYTLPGREGNSPLARPLAALVWNQRRPRQTPSGWLALCPAHDEHEPSLSIREGEGGRVLLKCHAGCDTREIIHNLGLHFTIFFQTPNSTEDTGSQIPCLSATHTSGIDFTKLSATNDPSEDEEVEASFGSAATTPPVPGCTVEQYSAAKRLPTDFLQSLGLSDGHHRGRAAIRITYRDEAVKPVGPSVNRCL